MKKFWEPQERESLLWTGNTLPDYGDIYDTTFLIISGTTCAGKSSIEKELIRTGMFFTVRKTSTRNEKLEEIHGVIPFEKIGFKEWFNLEDEPRLETVNVVGAKPPYEEWQYWGRKLGVSPPTVEELSVELEQLIASFLLCNILKDVSIAKSLGKMPIIGLFPQDAAAWKRYFPRSIVVSLDSNPIITKERIKAKWGLESAIARARLLDAVSAPKVLVHQGEIVLSTDNIKLMDSNLGKILCHLATCRGGLPPGGGSL